MTPAPSARLYLPLYAFFLWWVAVLLAQALVDIGGVAIEVGLANRGTSIQLLFALQVAEQLLSLCLLWAVVAVVFLRPHALEPGQLWHHPGMLALVVCALLGASAATMGIATLRWAMIAQLLTPSDLAWLAVRQQGLAVAVRALQVFTWAGVAVGLWVKLGAGARRDS